MTSIRVGIGGWQFAPWRGTFYPAGLPRNKELAFASRAVTSIEINGTFYRTQPAASFRRWFEETPPDFKFALKAPRAITHRRDLAQAHESITRFLGSGITELGVKLGPILWQLPPHRSFDPAMMGCFLQTLPSEWAGLELRHVIETYHPSFATPEWIELLRQHEVAAAIVQSEKHAMLADATAPFIYARLELNAAEAPEGYDSEALDAWANRFRAWNQGKPVRDLATIGRAVKPRPRDCFIYFISGDKARAPDAARAMLGRLTTA